MTLARRCLLAWQNSLPVDESTQEQINDLAGLRDEHEKRLNALLRQQARLGRASPVEINLEIEEIQVKVSRITADMARLQIGASRILQITAHANDVNSFSDISNQIGDTTTTVLHSIHSLIALILQEQDEDEEKRNKRQNTTNLFYILICALVLADILVRIFIH